jgi:hypothetical protein
MERAFQNFVEKLEPKYRDLLAMSPVTCKSLPRELPKRAIYLFSDGNEYLYVGRTNRLRQRLRDHCAKSASHNSATFAFRIARRETGILKATYTTKGSRASLLTNPKFRRAFDMAKQRIQNMSLRFVEESDPTHQALLEIYVSTVLDTQYNDFENH